MEDSTQLIDMSDYLSLFKDYLDGNSRCMLSAPFGEGKSTFLNKFCEAYEEEYCFIKLYPINYQVSGSEDVFKMIKYDILVQLMGMEDLDDAVPQGSAIWGFLKENFFDLSIDLVKGLSCIPGAVVIGKPVELLIKNIKKISDYSTRKKCETNKGMTETFIKEVREMGGAFEFDGITMLIIALLRKYKEETKKKMVMVVEEYLRYRLADNKIERILQL
ncbi:MAG: hypothetical protein PHG78_07580 [Bacteroidales bacterium]|nr:hypothetical protein [Bacteroidales bacterium]